MSHDDRPEHEHADEHNEVRALLADLPTPPLPADVARRLDDVLAELATEAPDADDTDDADAGADVVTLPARVRRRWGAALVAASVAAVVGLGLTQVLGPDAAHEATSAADVATDVTTGATDAGEEADNTEGAASPPGAPESAARDEQSEGSLLRADSFVELQGLGGAAVPSVRSGSFAVTVPGLVAALEDDPTTEDPAAREPADRENRLPLRGGSQDGALTGGSPTAARSVACVASPPLAAGDRSWPIRLDGRRGVLVLRAPGSAGAGPDERLAEAWRCADLAADRRTPARVSALVPAP